MGIRTTTEDLRVYESAILDVAHEERIDLDDEADAGDGRDFSEIVLNILLDHTSTVDPAAIVRGDRGSVGCGGDAANEALARAAHAGDFLSGRL